MSFVICTEHSGEEPDRQAGVGSNVTSVSLGDVMVSTLTRNVRDVSSIPGLGTIFHIFIIHTTTCI